MTEASPFRGFIPITNDNTPVRQIFNEAVDEIPRMARRARVRLVSRPILGLTPGPLVQGAGAHNLVVTVSAWATPLERPTDA